LFSAENGYSAAQILPITHMDREGDEKNGLSGLNYNYYYKYVLLLVSQDKKYRMATYFYYGVIRERNPVVSQKIVQLS
jgi:hypothetical protein